MEAVGFGDCHFDKLDSILPDASNLIVKAISRVFDYAIENGITHVFQYGDVGEKPRLSYDSQVALYKLLGKKKYKDLDVHFVLGNHDFAEDGTHSLQVLETFSQWFGHRDKLHVYTKREHLDIEGVPFNFLPYPFTETVKDRINIGHFEVAGSIRDNGRAIGEGKSTKHHTLMGHLHTKHRVRNTHFSGTLYQTNFGEALPKFFHHVRLAEGAPVSELDVECIKFNPPWKLINLTINSVKDLDVLDHDPRILYKLFLKAGLDVDLNSILTDYPNVVRHNVFKNKKDLEVLVTREWDFDTDLVSDVGDFDELGVVKEFLSTSGLKKDQVARGMSILKGLHA